MKLRIERSGDDARATSSQQAMATSSEAAMSSGRSTRNRTGILRSKARMRLLPVTRGATDAGRGRLGVELGSWLPAELVRARDAQAGVGDNLKPCFGNGAAAGRTRAIGAVRDASKRVVDLAEGSRFDGLVA